MAALANTKITVDDNSVREELSDVITRIEREETPFYSMCKKGTTASAMPEWLEVDLDAVDKTNAVVEADEHTNEAPKDTMRLKNHSQMSKKVYSVSGREEGVKKAGIPSALNFQYVNKGLELRRDVEGILTGEQGSIANATGIAPLVGALESWSETAVSRGAGGANGGFTAGTGLTTAPTDGTQRAFTEDLLLDTLQAGWTAGSKLTYAMMGAVQKRALAGFTGAVGRRVTESAASNKITYNIEVYESPFGEIKVTLNPHMRERSVLLLDKKHLEIKTVSGRNFERQKLAKTGDATREAIVHDYSLCVGSEKAVGVIADLNT